MLFTEDTVLEADGKKKSESLVVEFGWTCRRKKLKVNKTKNKVMLYIRESIVGKRVS